jgi:hypothetical protein
MKENIKNTLRIICKQIFLNKDSCSIAYRDFWKSWVVRASFNLSFDTAESLEIPANIIHDKKETIKISLTGFIFIDKSR